MCVSHLRSARLRGRKTFHESLRAKVTRLDCQSLPGSNETQTTSGQAHATLPMQRSLLQREAFRRQSSCDTPRSRGTWCAGWSLAAPDFRCSVAGYKRAGKDFSRHWNIDQHYCRIHGRSNNEEENNKAPLNKLAEAETNYLSSVEPGESANGTPQARATSGEIIGQAYNQASITSDHQSPHRQNSALVKAVQAELDSVRAQKLEASHQFGGRISTLEAALAVL